MTRLRRAMVFLGLRRSIVGLLGMVVLVGMGEKMADRFLPVYVVALGGGSLAVGLMSGLKNLLGALYSFPSGYLSDRYGPKRALLWCNLFAMVGYVIVIAIPSWPAVIVGSCFFLAWTALSLPATMGLVAKVLPSGKHTMGVTMNSLVRRLPMAAGPVLGGLLIDRYGPVHGVRMAFAAALLLAGVAIVLQQRLIADDRPAAGDAAGPRPERNPRRLWREMPAALRSLLVSDILVRFCEQIPDAFVVLWCLKVVAQPVRAEQFGILSAVEMATAVLIYIPVAYLADRGHKKPFVLMTFVFFTAFPLVLMHCQSFGPLVLAFVVRGLKEFGEPTRKALIMDLAPKDRKAAMFGLYYLVRDLVVSLAAFGGGLLWRYTGPRATLATAVAFGLAGTLWFALRGADLGPAPADG